jgi:glycogen phosphorylase
VYLDNYDMDLAKLIVSGVDLWLNTPNKPMEASGTSGMKAAHNGVPSLSVLDGWWIEGWMEDVTGWSIGPSEIRKDGQDAEDSKDLYEKLEKKILPTFANNKHEWIRIMKQSISYNASFFNGHRMVNQYVLNSYFE